MSSETHKPGLLTHQHTPHTHTIYRFPPVLWMIDLLCTWYTNPQQSSIQLFASIFFMTASLLTCMAHSLPSCFKRYPITKERVREHERREKERKRAKERSCAKYEQISHQTLGIIFWILDSIHLSVRCLCEHWLIVYFWVDDDESFVNNPGKAWGRGGVHRGTGTWGE